MHSENIGGLSASRIPVFDQTQLDSVRPPIDLYKWEKVLDLFSKGMYKESLIAMLDFIDNQLVQKTGNQDKSEFNIPHGSIILNLKIDHHYLIVTVPFLKIPATNNIPLMKRVAQLNFNPLNLSELLMEKNQLLFKYTCSLEMCEPHKIYEVLKEICTCADLYENQLIKKFGAEQMNKPMIRQFSREFVNFAWQRIQLYLKEAFPYIKFFQEKKLFHHSLALTTVTLLKIHYYIEPRGILGSSLQQVIALLQQREIPLPDKLKKGLEFLQYLQKYNPDEFSKELYAVDIFIPIQYRVHPEKIKTYWQDISGPVKESEITGDYTVAVLTIQHAFFDILYKYIVPEDTRKLIIQSLLNSNGKTWQQAASILEDALDAIIKTFSDFYYKIEKHIQKQD